jgi:uncharacterized membrane protein
MLVHFPIALVTIGFLSELASIYIKKEACLSKLGFYLLLVGTISALFALLSGLIFTNEMSGAAGEIMEIHEFFAYTTLSTLLVTSILRIYITVKKIENSTLIKVAFVLYALAAISVGITGFYGGTLVFNYMMPL